MAPSKARMTLGKADQPAAESRAQQSVDALPQVFTHWFAARGWAPRSHQLDMLDAARNGESALLIAPTGAGKTLAGFLPSLIDIGTRRRNDRSPALHTLYISPLKALAVDVARNLTTPIAEMRLPITVETRTGDTPPARRQRQRSSPPDILLTTPEQLELLIGSENASTFFADLQCVIIDEAHAIAPGKRGDLVSLCLGALSAWQPNLRRVGLSATVADEEALAQWMIAQPRGGRAKARIVRGPIGAQPEVNILLSEERIPWSGHTGRHAMAEVYEAIKGAGVSLVFVNTRFQAELSFQELWKINDENLAIALHHGSLDVGQRRKVEAAMAKGDLRAIVCTSTLDLGIDWGNVDLVIQMGPPKGSARLIQRIGRANHRLDEPSKALLVPTNRFEMLECLAAQSAVSAGLMDGSGVRIGALDILAQHIMGRACGEGFEEDALFAEICTAAPYQALSRDMFDRVLSFVATGGYALGTYEKFRRIAKGRDGVWRPRNRDVAQRWRMNVGAIVEAPLLKVRLATPRKGPDGKPGSQRASYGGRVLGEIEEHFVEQLSPGDTFLFAGEVLRFHAVAETDALCSRAAGQTPKIPSWGGGKFPLSTFLAKGVRTLIQNQAGWRELHPQLREWIEMQALKSAIPAADAMLIETFPRAGKFYLVAYPFEGRLAHQTLGMLLTRRLERIGVKPLGFVANDYALSVWGLEDMAGLDFDALFDQDMLGDDLDAWLAESMLMKRTFRTCAVIAGLIERRFPGQEKSGRQVTFSSDLIYDVLRSHEPDHILIQAAWADAGEGLLDIRRLGDLLARVKGHLQVMRLSRVSPFAVPIMLEIGKIPVAGAAHEAILAEAEGDLVHDAMANLAR